MLGVGGERPVEGLEFGGDGIAALVGFVLKDGDISLLIELDISVVRAGDLGNKHLQAGTVGGHPAAREPLLPVKSVDASEQVRGALDELHERAHGQRNSAFVSIAPNPIEWSEQPELLVDEPRKPLARDLRAFVRRGQ